MRLVSACLLGVNCKYSGENNSDTRVIDMLKHEILIPVCPEQLGGMSTPRYPAEIIADKVVNEEGLDVTEHFVKGARETLVLAKMFGIEEAILKDGSPSCASSLIYDGNFSKTKIKGEGYTARLLRKNGIKVISENDL
ncbi:MAG: DUF523 domain-containing protein [Acidaminobacteraceae bacterium]